MHGSSLYVCAGVYKCMHESSLYVRVFIGVYAWMEFICKRVSICVCVRQVYMYMQVIHKCICIITNIRCIGMDFILVCTCISYIYIYIYIEHPMVYMYV